MSTLPSASAARRTLAPPDTPGPGPWINDSPEARIEELEEMLRRIVIVVHPDPRLPLTDTEQAILAMACDVLGLDTPVALSNHRQARGGKHLFAV